MPDRSMPTPLGVRDAVQAAFKSFEDRRDRTANETTTRVELIDEILRALGWPAGSIERELPTGTGDFIDYELRANGAAWLLVEAKRAGENFRLNLQSGRKGRAPHRSRSIASLFSTGGESLRAVLKQAAGYCNDHGIALACATNGFEWLFFRGLSTQNRQWTKGTAIIFSGCEDIVARFDEFLACIGRDAVGTPYLYERLELPSSGMLPPSWVPNDVLTYARRERAPQALAAVRAVSEFLFLELFGAHAPEMIKHCYVQPGTSDEFERSIQRLLKDSEVRLDESAAPVPTDTEKFVAHVERSDSGKAKQPVVVVGNVGVGKTTFLHRSLSQMRGDRSAICAVIDLEGFGGSGEDSAGEQARVASEILDKLQTAALTVLKHRADVSDAARLQGEHSSRETLSTLQRNKLTNTRRLSEALWKADETGWLRKELEIFEELTRRPLPHLVAYIRNLHGRFSKKEGGRYPILVAIDNLDLGTDEYQRTIYGLAQQVARDTDAIVVICLREDTFRLGREPGGFLTSSALPFVFHVARPPLGQLLRKRVSYGEYATDQENRKLLPSGLRNDAPRVKEVCSLVRSTLLTQKSESLELFAGLAGHNMRAALELVRALIDGSVDAPDKPDASATYAFQCLLAAPGYHTLQARVVNCLDAEPAPAPAHALQARLLAYYSFAVEAGPERTLLEDADQALVHFSGWGYPLALIRSALVNLLRSGLLRDLRDTWRTNNELPRRLTISASGHVHLNRLADLRAYRAAVSGMTRWYDRELAERFIRVAGEAGGVGGLSQGDILESKAVDIFDAYLAQAITREDATLTIGVAAPRWQAEVLSRSARVLPPRYQPVPTAPQPISEVGLMPPKRRSRTERKPDQLNLIAPDKAPEDTPQLEKIHRDAVYKGTVWTPRVLWALEFARRRHLEPQRASDLADLLSRYGDIDVPRENVARAFREFRVEHGVDGLWTSEKKRYAITEAGTMILQALLAAEADAP